MNTTTNTTTNTTDHGAYSDPAVRQAIAAEVRRQQDNMVECRECNGTGQIPAGIDREAGRDPGRDCWKCHGYGEHIR